MSARRSSAQSSTRHRLRMQVMTSANRKIFPARVEHSNRRGWASRQAAPATTCWTDDRLSYRLAKPPRADHRLRARHRRCRRARRSPRCRTHRRPRGLTCQRNRIIQAAAPDTDILIFLDDDFIPAPNFISRMAGGVCREPDVTIATGEVLADGILGGGLSMSDGAGNHRNCRRAGRAGDGCL